MVSSIRAAVIFRYLVLLLGGLQCLLFLSVLPFYYNYMRVDCTEQACTGASITPLFVLLEWSGSRSIFAAFHAGLDFLYFGLFLVPAILIYIRIKKEWIGLLGSLTLITFVGSSTFPSLLFQAPEWQFLIWIGNTTDALSLVTFTLFFLLFPDNKPINTWTLWVVLSAAIVRVASFTIFRNEFALSEWPLWVTLLWMTILFGSLIYSQYYKYRFLATPTQQQQTKWVVYGFITAVILLFSTTLLPLLVRPDFYFVYDPLPTFIQDIVVRVIVLLIPLTFTISILRHRLWEIDPIMNRTLVYGGLTGSIIALYALTIWYLDTIFHSKDNQIISFIAACLIAVLFAPLKEWLQRAVNRRMYGEMDDPFSILTRLGNQLKEPLAPEAIIELVAKTVKDALRLPYIEITLQGKGLLTRMVSLGKQSAETIPIPLMIGGEELGQIRVSPRSPGEQFSSADRRVLDMLVRQAEVVLQSVIQTHRNLLLASDLQQSRERLILSREEERRSIRRNLHDDLAPTLAALGLTAEIAMDLVHNHPDQAAEMLSELKTMIQDTVHDIRGLVHDLRPPALDELGLLGAIRQRADQIMQIREWKLNAESPVCEIKMKEISPLPPLPAAVEVAAFRILTEAMANAIRHSQASECEITIRYIETEARLELIVSDNGIGPPSDLIITPGTSGLGLLSIRERADELGGKLRVEHGPHGGTVVLASLPVVNNSNEEVSET
jgi:signal transduction histidine kinase